MRGERIQVGGRLESGRLAGKIEEADGRSPGDGTSQARAGGITRIPPAAGRSEAERPLELQRPCREDRLRLEPLRSVGRIDGDDRR